MVWLSFSKIEEDTGAGNVPPLRLNLDKTQRLAHGHSILLKDGHAVQQKHRKDKRHGVVIFQ